MVRFALAFFMLASIIACNKDSDSVSATEALTGSKWQLDRVLVQNPPGSTPSDVTLTNYKLCELDDIFEFKTSGSYTASENSLVCIPTNNSPFYNLGGGTWALSGADTVLTISKGTNMFTLKIKSYNVNALDLRQRYFNTQGQEVEYSYNFSSVQ